MKKTSGIFGLVVLLSFISSALSAAETLPVDQVKKGMKGYGLTVFEGERIDRFDVEILGVLKNIGPKQDLILARVDSEVIRKSGVIAGMSGSPIYLEGKLIGALAYSWQFSRDGVAGITPIDEMLRLKRSGGAPVIMVAPKMTSSQFFSEITNRALGDRGEAYLASLIPARGMTAGGALPISIPISLSRFAPETVDRYSQLLEASGLMSVPSGSSGSGGGAVVNGKPAKGAAPFQPGDAVAGILIDGDLSIAASGTVTYVDGDHVYAFGHPFLDMGAISFPMAKSDVVGVLPSIARSFKFSNTGRVVGALEQDRYAGILGRLGATAPMIPIQLNMESSAGSQRYDVRVIRHPQLSPLMLAMATDTVVANAQRAAGDRTVRIDSEIKIAGFPAIRLQEGWAGSQARQAIPAYLAMVSGYLMSNEFLEAPIETVKVTLRHDDDLKIASLIEASVDTPRRGVINPGDTVRVRVLLKPFRGEPFAEELDVKIPDNQQPGPVYLMIGSGSTLTQLDFALVPPDPRNLPQMLAVLGRLRPATELSIGLYASSQGSVTAGVYLPDLPPSVSALVTADSSNSIQAPVRYAVAQRATKQLEYIIDGSKKLELDIRAAR
ncbi:MAG TPA: SpoIVB peptidase S55 domain-containing protein [Thermoanaerobaculia bacterium]|nr:SpoIVB peptidase S55 domain-containing protein [Thermoanaerobaculia bacterium]